MRLIIAHTYVPCPQTVTVEGLGLQVTWNGERVEVIVPRFLRGQVCGMCGYYDGRPSNDLTVGPSEDCTRNIPGMIEASGETVRLVLQALFVGGRYIAINTC